MGRVNDTISNVNAAIRNLLLAALVGGAGFAGYIGYDLYNAPRQQLQEKEKQLAEKDVKLQTALADLTAKEKANASFVRMRALSAPAEKTRGAFPPRKEKPVTGLPIPTCEDSCRSERSQLSI